MKNHTFDQMLLDGLNVRQVEHLEELQTLWSGYGVIERVALHGETQRTAIIKHIRLGQPPAARETSSHRRKLESYQVEIAWYRQYSSKCDGACRVPRYLYSATVGDELLIVLEDLDAAGFPLRRDHLSDRDADACLSWLANFHATFLHHGGAGLWDTGTYWHLATRAEELRAMPKGRLKRRAQRLDEQLRDARFQTLVHGDAKPENFCFSKDGWAAAVDFQYVGRGAGVRDVAYFLWGLPSRKAEALVERYFEHLGAALESRRPDADFCALRAEWAALYAVARDDFERFLQGWLALR